MTPTRTLRFALLGSVVALPLAGPAVALDIVPFFDSTITGAGNAAAIEATINAAAAVYGTLFSDVGTVNIVFRLGNTSLGSTTFVPYFTSYATFTGLLAADAAANPSNTVLPVALANLGSGNDANGATSIWATSALLRVGLGEAGAAACFNAAGGLALNFSATACIGTYDAVITLSSFAPIDFTHSGTPGTYDGRAVVSHEIDEVLGAGGPGSTLNQFAASCSGTTPGVGGVNAYGPLDLYRYSAPGTPSFTTCSTATSYLSVDGGVTSIVAFNQNSGGDFADFAAPTPQIQNAFATPGVALDLSTASPEYVMLQSIGWDPIPEPASMALFGLGLAGLAAARRRGA